MRTKDVVITRMAGASDIIVSTARICMLVATSCGFSDVPTPTLTVGIRGAADACPAPRSRSAVPPNTNKMRPNSFPPFLMTPYFRKSGGIFCTKSESEPN